MNGTTQQPALTTEQQIEALNTWLLKYQPCVFGRVAARLNAVTYCILGEDDLRRDDAYVYERIQEARARWKALAYEVVQALSSLHSSPETCLGYAVTTMLQLAQRVCQLYLTADTIEPDVIYTDNIELEIPLSRGKRSAVMFDVGVNFFAAAADGRWWQDHRIPGGVAFSMNSVGHLVKSGQLHRLLAGVEALVGHSVGDAPPKLESLPEALRWAMQTISNASQTISGPATTVCYRCPKLSEPDPHCPLDLPRSMAGKNYCQYAGWYHTDITLPAENFRTGCI